MAKKDKFQLSPEGKLFSTYERATIIHHLIEEVAGIDITRKIDSGEIISCFPLHEQVKTDYVLREGV